MSMRAYRRRRAWSRCVSDAWHMRNTVLLHSEIYYDLIGDQR